MDYEFDAPVYLDFENPDSGNVKCLGTTEAKAEQHFDEGDPESVEEHLSSEGDPSAKQKMDYMPKATTQTLKRSSDKQLNQPVRQSPRLAAIAKSIRRSNASRGLLVPTSSRASSGIPKAHRRSLSEGADISTRFSKIEKTTAQRKVPVVRTKQIPKTVSSGLTKDDLACLDQANQYKKILSINHHRNVCLSSSKGPVKPRGVRAAPQKPTKPAEFYFATDLRVKSKDNVNDQPTVNFQHTLRSHSTCSNPALPKGTTKVQPFHLHGSSKPKEVAQPFVSLAELNLKFQTKTPQRFRTKRYHTDEPAFLEFSKKTRASSTVTRPQTPKLTSKLRARPVNYPTREEIEEKELEEAQKHQFKARALSKKILVESPAIQPSEALKQVTIPEPFNITDMKKVVNDSIENTLLDMCPAAFGSAVSLASIPHGGLSSSWHKKSTEIKPFSFDSRDAELIRKKKEKIKMLIEEEKKKAEFHAQPMPIFDGVKGLPAKKPPTPTKVQPFNLRSDIRGSVRQEALQRELEALEEFEKQQRKFTAQSDTVVHKAPFLPQKSNKPLTDISGFSLNTDRRAEERQAFDIHLKQKEDELIAKKKQLEERKMMEEAAEIQKMRKTAVHKAQPVRHYKPVEIKQGLLPATIPLSPNFSTDQRLRTRSKSEQMVISSDSTINSTLASSGQADGTFSMD